MERITFSEAARLAKTAFRNAGVPDFGATNAAEILTITEAMGIATHGLTRVEDYVRRIGAGGIDPSAELSTSAPAPALRHVDGKNGLGPAIARSALDEAIDAARNFGIGAVFVRGGSHLGALSPYLFLAAEAGFAAVMTTNTAPMIAPAGGRSPRIGNNPFGLVIPHPDGKHVLLDMSLSVVARSRVRSAARSGLPIPETWATDAQGRATTDADAAMQGLMSAIGGAKGANLALCLDLMAAGLSGAGMLSEVPSAADHPERVQNLGYMIILINAACLASDEVRRSRLDAAAEIIREAPALEETESVRMPGARALDALKTAQKTGLKIDAEVLSFLRSHVQGSL